LGLTFDDRYLENFPLPFPFPFFGQVYSSVNISSNGNLFFQAPPKRPNGDADDVPGSAIGLSNFKMISGLWDDLYLGTDQRADADVYMFQPAAKTVIFRWQGVPCNFNGNVCTFGPPVNFEIELRDDGTIKSRYGSGNTGLFPVVGISGGEPDTYLIPTHTSEANPINLTNAQTITYSPVAIGPVHAIRGQLMYLNGTTPVKDCLMVLTGPAGFTPRNAITDSNGMYSFEDVPDGGNYIVTASKSGGVNGITAFDSSLAARFAANLITLTPSQVIAADASGNGVVTAFDASLIARTAANIPNTGLAGTWKFLPDSLNVLNLSSDQTNQTVTAILVGDVSGNWTPN